MTRASEIGDEDVFIKRNHVILSLKKLPTFHSTTLSWKGSLLALTLAFVALTVNSVFMRVALASSVASRNMSADVEKESAGQKVVGAKSSATRKSSSRQGSWDDGYIRSLEERLIRDMNEFEKKIQRDRFFKAKTSERFLFLYNVSDAYIEWLNALALEVGAAFDKFCGQLRLEVTPPSTPLVVVVFATREEFDAYAVTISGPSYLEQESKPTGFYNHGFNRSVLYDLTASEASRVDAESESDSSSNRVEQGGREFTRRQLNREARAMKTRGNAVQNTSVIVHELQHQLAFNYGVFPMNSRLPDWLVEGMATTFEPTDDEALLGWRFRNVFPVNEGRLRAFERRVNQDDNFSILDEIIESDDFAQELSIDGYAASWALFYYCYRKKPKELKKYIDAVRKRSMRVSSPEERKAEFVDAFGEIEEFGKPFIRYIRSLNTK